MTLWGGRFAEEPDAVLWAFTRSEADHRLLADDVAGSIAHARMLGEVGILDDDETKTIIGGLERIAEEAASGGFRFLDGDEDVHSAVDRRLRELTGPVGGKLHTGRSRNDQVVLDLRLYLRRAGAQRRSQLLDFIALLVDKAEEVGDVIVPAYTHLQQAQAIPLAHHLLAYAWMLVRDAKRFSDAEGRIAVSPLGAGAAAGSGLALEPRLVATELDLPTTFDNSLDAVASRDFVAEYAFCCTQALVHLSRLGEELVLWASTEFGWATYADRHTTGSSALPHKKNPDIAEVARGKAATAIGHLTGLLTLQKGLPLAYNRDLQEDKEAIFAVDDALAGTLDALGGLLEAADFHPPEPSPWVTAADLAEALAARGVPFRHAHDAVGRLVAGLIEKGRTLADVRMEDLKTSDDRFIDADLDLIDPRSSVERRTYGGSGSMASVEKQIAELRAILGEVGPGKSSVP